MSNRFKLYKFREGEFLRLKKKHPCGNDIWLVTRAGMDISIKCRKCNHLLTLARPKLEKSVKEIIDYDII